MIREPCLRWDGDAIRRGHVLSEREVREARVPHAVPYVASAQLPQEYVSLRGSPALVPLGFLRDQRFSEPLDLRYK